MTLLLNELPLRLPTISNFLFRLMMKYALGFNMQKNTEYCTYYILCTSTYICAVLKYYYFIDVFHVTQKHSYVSPLHQTLGQFLKVTIHMTFWLLNTLETHKDTFCFLSLHVADQSINLLIWYSFAIYSLSLNNLKTKKEENTYINNI